ncbi:MAG: Nramp family divalent metal transporter [Clostridia bacterium]
MENTKKLKNSSNHGKKSSSIEFLKYIGPGLLVTVGFIDPGNWASNIAAGSEFGYTLLWVVTLSTIMLMVLQHNAAHLGIVTGLCIAESITTHINPLIGRLSLGTAVLASISTALAEILGGAIALQLLFHLPIQVGAIIVAIFVLFMLFSNSYKKLEKVIIGFVSIIGFSFIIELALVKIDWPLALVSWVKPSFPAGSIFIIMSVLGAVVMPHNLFLHSEIIQSRQWNLQDEAIMEKQLKFEFMDTAFSMFVGWAINSAMILVAAATFYAKGIQVSALGQAVDTLKPLLGNMAALIFAIALLFAGVASAITAGMAGGSIFAGMFNKAYDTKSVYTKIGICITIVFALCIIFFIGDPFKALLLSQMLLSIQLPITIFSQIYLTSSKKVMGIYANSLSTKVWLLLIGTIVTALNVVLLYKIIKG